MIAHTRQAAARLSELFRKQQVEKTYRVTIRGRAGDPGTEGTIDQPLDGKPALSRYLSWNRLTPVRIHPITDAY